MSFKPKAIETSYKGHQFRSRLEARWAVFFDAIGIRWRYETQGYYVGIEDAYGMAKYLPDFYLPDTETWVEVKGDLDDIDWQKLAMAIDFGAGLPKTEDSFGTTRGLLLLGAIPICPAGRLPVHPMLQHSRGGWVTLANFAHDGFLIYPESEAYFDASWGRQEDGWIDYVKERIGGEYSRDMADGSVWPLRVRAAYDAARKARFEFGQTPAVENWRR